jgi:hypothetical protein
MGRFVGALLLISIQSWSQELTLGVKGGFRLTGDTIPDFLTTADSKRYVVGPTIEVGLPFHFAVEADAQYSRLGNTFYYPGIANESVTRTIANSWVFPLVLNYRLPGRRIHPFVSGGVALRRTSGDIHTIHYGFYPGDITFYSAPWSGHDHGFVCGAGVGARLGRIRISPEVRYFRWHVPSFPTLDDAASYLRTSPVNEVQLLLGIGWAVR